VRCDLDIAGRLHLHLSGYQFGRGRVPDGDEHAVGWKLADRAGLHVLEANMCDLARVFVAADLLDGGVPDHLDLGVFEEALLQDALGAEAVAAVDDGDLGGEVGEEQRFLDRGVAAADHHDLLASVEEAVAGGAGRGAEALERFLRRNAEPARLRAGGEDDGVRHIDVAGIADEAERTLAELELGHQIGDDLGADMGRLLLHLLHQPGALDHVGEAGIVLDVGGDGELSAGLNPLDQDRIEHRACRIDGGGVSRGSRTDNDDFGVNGLGHYRDFLELASMRPCGLCSLYRLNPSQRMEGT
jgi:hypothetical protein